jgi:hypothetical protein
MPAQQRVSKNTIYRVYNRFPGASPVPALVCSLQNNNIMILRCNPQVAITAYKILCKKEFNNEQIVRTTLLKNNRIFCVLIMKQRGKKQSLRLVSSGN